MSKAPVSACLIVRNEEAQIESCLKSIRDFVEEIVVVDTGSTDSTPDIVRKYSDKFEIFTECNNPETGLIEDFSMARNFSFSLGSCAWRMWVDGDDEVQGMGALNSLILYADSTRNGRPTNILWPYEYSHDELGNPTTVHYRERLISSPDDFVWVNPVHEVLIPKPGIQPHTIHSTEIKVVHRRQNTTKQIESGRNLRILKKLYEREGEKDARHLYYLGLEYGNNGFVDEAIKFLTRYIEMSGWEDESYMACLRIIEHCKSRSQIQETMDWCFRAIRIREDWGEAYFELAKCYYLLACSGGIGERRNWERCVHFAQHGLSLPPTQTLLFVNPLERNHEIHKYLNVALSKTNRTSEARISADLGLKTKPDVMLEFNRKIYDKHLSTIEIRKNVDILIANGSLNEISKIKISDIIEGRVSTEQTSAFSMAHGYELPEVFEPLVPKIQESSLISILMYRELFNDFIARNDKVSIKKLLESIPKYITECPEFLDLYSDVREALGFEVYRMKGNVEHVRTPLDIALYVGPGVERWNPETITKSGIGGSETAAYQMAKRLVANGNRVRLYGDCTDIEGTFDGVQYVDYSKFSGTACDILVTSRRPSAIDNPIGYKAVVCWVHDVHCGAELTHERALRINKFFTLSHWHKNFFQNTYEYVHPDQVEVTQNGIDLNRFNRAIVRNPHRAIYSSSPDRGLESLLQMWPKIRSKVPDAELHVFYGFGVWETSAQSVGDQGQFQLIQRLKVMLDDSRVHGVVFHGRKDQLTMAREFLASSVWTYPTWFSETSCQLAGSLVSTKHGMKPIEDIKIGDLVLTHKGRFRPVTELIKKRYDGPLYIMKRKKDTRSIALTGEHPIYTGNFHKNISSKGNRVYSRRNDKLSWKIPSELIPELDYLTTPRMESGNKTHIKLSDYVGYIPVIDGIMCTNPKISHYHKVKDEIELTHDFMYVLGLFAAEGCVSQSPKRHGKRRWYTSIIFAFHKKETNLIVKIQDFFGRGTVKSSSENGVSVCLYSSPWANFLKHTIGTGRKKKIPDFVWDSSLELQASFLQGMTDGDGCELVKTNRTKKEYIYSHYTSVSPSLAYGAAQILANIGLFPSIAYNSKRKSFDLSWSKNPKNLLHKSIDSTYCTRLSSISTEHYSGLVYNFEVEEDRSYVTDRTVVHNCITGMEAQAAGLRIITSPIAALNETVGNRGVMIQGDWLSAEYQEKFVDATVDAMTRTSNEDRFELQKFAKKNFSWDKVAAEWDVSLRRIIDDAQTSILVPYKGANRKGDQ